MATQTEQRSLAARPGEQQTQRKDVSRSASGYGLQQRRGEYPLALSPFDLVRASPFSLFRRMSEEMDRMLQEAAWSRESGDRSNGWMPAI
jgi:hypothetical protein